MLLDGEKRGTIRAVKGGRYAVKGDSDATHYYDIERLTMLSDDDAVPAEMDGAPIIKWHDLDTLKSIDKPDSTADHNRDEAPTTDERQPARPAPTAVLVQPDQASLAVEPAPPVKVFSAPPNTANRAEIQSTCAMCGKPLRKRRGAKTCSDTCRKRYSRRKDDVQKSYRDAKRAIDALLKYASHDDLRDLLSVYVGELGRHIDTQKRYLDDLDGVRDIKRDTAAVTHDGSARRAAAAGRQRHQTGRG
ncbi:MAG: hypothetical protein CUN53_13970 [Phototrophicales bacterium]|nr:MAG: hypothetical protein CUN53_13970 [Phototrophicales bacterium]